MNSRELVSTAKYLASIKPTFRLSELQKYLSGDISLSQIYKTLTPHLPELDLSAMEINGDYQISRIQKQEKFVFSKEEKNRVDALLATRRIPISLERAIEQYISKKVGTSWDDPLILERLRKAITVQKDNYWRVLTRRSVTYAKGYSVLAYLAYHFPVYFMQTEYILRTLLSTGLFKSSINILDVGTGPGVVPIAIADFYSQLNNAKVKVSSIEQSEEHIQAFEFLTKSVIKSSKNITIELPIKIDLCNLSGDAQIPDPIDLLIFSNVLNELFDLPTEKRVEIVLHLSKNLSKDGSILLVEPAEEVNAKELRLISRKLADHGLTIHSPCTYLWGTHCDPSRCWSFETQPDIRPTRLMEALAKCNEPYRFINTDIKYAFAILRKDKKVQYSYRVPLRSKFSRFSKLYLHVNRRINVVAAKMSENLGDERTYVYKLCDGTAAKPAFAVLHTYHTSQLNDVIITLSYGTIVEIRNVLVRYNKTHDAYNLLISKNTHVDPIQK